MDLISLAWPDEISASSDAEILHYSSVLLRVRLFNEAEAVIASQLCCGRDQRIEVLWAKLLLDTGRVSQYEDFWYRWSDQQRNSPYGLYLDLTYKLLRHHVASKPLSSLSPVISNDALFYPLSLLVIKLSLLSGSVSEARDSYNCLPAHIQQSPEGRLLNALFLIQKKAYPDAFDVMRGVVSRFPAFEEAQALACDLAILSRSQEFALPVIKAAYSLFPSNPTVLRAAANVQALQHLAAESRKACLLERLVQPVCSKMLENQSNILSAYERVGNVDWLDHAILNHDSLSYSYLEAMQNLALQYSSYGSNALSLHLPKLSSLLKENLDARNMSSFTPRMKNASESLTIAWCSSDLAYHPVFRFVYSFFAASGPLSCNHIILDAFDHGGESSRHMIESLSNVTVVNLGLGDEVRRIDHARSLGIDVAIDLSGWTGGHFQSGFIARFAPVQINYLGYFASVGTSGADYWLGDHHLFPGPVSEWCTEEIFRLSRCFIAWQPAPALPEASVEVMDVIDRRGGIRFGSFNHNRKLSDQILRLWGRLLKAIPDSSLVLKASNRDDLKTMELLRRRMVHQGLDPARVIWLPRADTPEDHLRQYAYVDIALDTFPNGGCTTTCEALWMGVPVITLSGDRYVSRMSTAVLHGADMASWCASSEQAYLQLAIQQAEQLTRLRQSRTHWRERLQANPLGDAAGLMQHLEAAFTQMLQKHEQPSP